jgi:hypothetical protein
MHNIKFTVRQRHNIWTNAQQVFMLGINLRTFGISMGMKAVSISPYSFKAAMTFNKAFQIIWNSGASVCISHDRDDFVSYKSTPDIQEVKGLGGKTS